MTLPNHLKKVAEEMATLELGGHCYLFIRGFEACFNILKEMGGEFDEKKATEAFCKLYDLTPEQAKDTFSLMHHLEGARYQHAIDAALIGKLTAEKQTYLSEIKAWMATVEIERRNVAKAKDALTKLSKGNRAPGVLEIARQTLEAMK